MMESETSEISSIENIPKSFLSRQFLPSNAERGGRATEKLGDGIFERRSVCLCSLRLRLSRALSERLAASAQLGVRVSFVLVLRLLSICSARSSSSPRVISAKLHFVAAATAASATAAAAVGRTAAMSVISPRRREVFRQF